MQQQELEYLYQNNLGNKVLLLEIKMQNKEEREQAVLELLQIYSAAVDYFVKIQSPLFLFFKNKIQKLMIKTAKKQEKSAKKQQQIGKKENKPQKNVKLFNPFVQEMKKNNFEMETKFRQKNAQNDIDKIMNEFTSITELKNKAYIKSFADQKTQMCQKLRQRRLRSIERSKISSNQNSNLSKNNFNLDNKISNNNFDNILKDQFKIQLLYNSSMKFFEILKRLALYFIPLVSILAFFQASSFFIQQKKLQQSNIDFKTYIYKNLNHEIYGIWKQNQKQKNFFDNSKGLTEFRLLGDPKKFKQSAFKEGINTLVVNLTDRFKIATKHASIVLTKPQINTSKDIISFPLQNMNLNITKNQRMTIDKKCTISAKLYFSYNQKLMHQFLMLKIKSSDCKELNMKISSNFEFQDIQNIKILTHFCFMLIAIIFKYYFLAKLEKQLIEDDKMCNQISLITIMMFASFELLLGLEQFVICSMHQMGFNLIIIIGLLCFSLFFYNILRIVSLILKKQVQNYLLRNQNFNLKNFLINIYFKAHFTILGIFFLNVHFNGSKNLYLCWTFMLLPQILQICFQKQRFISSNQNIIVYYFISMVIVCHTYFSQNYYTRVDRFKGSQNYVMELIIISTAQILILLIQEIISPFFFLPKFLMSYKFHNYFISQQDLKKNLTEEQKGEENVCVICFQNLSEKQDCEDFIEDIEVHKNIKEYIIQQTKTCQLMKTPCQHYFHSKCLLTWMNIKMNCPMCKVSLPTFE